MTELQRTRLIANIQAGHNAYASPYSDVREAVTAVVDIVVTALEDMECEDD